MNRFCFISVLYCITLHAGKIELKFLDAVIKNRYHEAHQLINYINPNCHDSAQRTPLMLAAGLGHTTLIPLLLKAGANPTLTDQFSRTCLHYAAHFGNREIIKQFLQETVDIDSRDAKGRTPLMYACSPSRRKIMVRIIKKATDNDFFKFSFSKLAYRTILSVIRLLLEKGADINAVDKKGRTALILAAMRANNTHVCCFLLHAGANPRSVTLSQKTILHKMLSSPAFPLTKTCLLFIAYGTSVAQKDTKERTAEDIAEAKNLTHISNVLKIFSHHGEIMANDDHNLSKQLYFKAFKGEVSEVQALLRQKADPLWHYADTLYFFSNSISLVNFLITRNTYPHLLENFLTIMNIFPSDVITSHTIHVMRKDPRILYGITYFSFLVHRTSISLPADITIFIVHKTYPEYCERIIEYCVKVFHFMLKKNKIKSLMPYHGLDRLL